MNKKTFIANDGRKYQKSSRWIKIQYSTIKNKKHSLYNYKEDDNSIAFFTNSGKKYAISQFIQMPHLVLLQDMAIIGGYDISTSYKPYLLEMSGCAEYVRLWEEVSDI